MEHAHGHKVCKIEPYMEYAYGYKVCKIKPYTECIYGHEVYEIKLYRNIRMAMKYVNLNYINSKYIPNSKPIVI